MARLRVVANAWPTYENVMTLRCTQSIWMSWIRIQQQCACVHRARKFSLIDVRGLRARGVAAAAASTATSLLLERCRFSFRHLRRQCRSPGRRCPAPYPPPGSGWPAGRSRQHGVLDSRHQHSIKRDRRVQAWNLSAMWYFLQQSIFIGWQWRNFDASWLSSPSCG